MLKLMAQGGPLMWLILGLAVVAVAIFLERWLSLHRAHINTADFVNGIRNILRRGNINEALSLCEETPGPVPPVIKAGIDNRERSREEIREAMLDVGHSESARLERRLVVLATIAQVAPLIGFLGTVFGMIQMFREIQQATLPSPGQLAGGVWTALLTTAGGLIVAVPAYIAYNFLVTRVQHLVLDMERAANEMLAFFVRRKEGTDREETKPAPKP